MALKRLKPLINQRDLGYVRLWQDELAEIVRLMRQLDGADVHIEADEYVVDDVESDFPKIGAPRVKSFKSTAMRTVGDEPPHEILKIELTRDRSQVEAADPDLTTLGAMEAITSLTDRCRRIPGGGLTKFFGTAPGNGWDKIIIFSVVVPGLVWIVSILAADSIAGLIAHSSKTFVPQFIWWTLTVAAALLCIAFFVGFARARTVLYTGTRAEAPTWWQEHGSDIAINIAVSAVSLVVGLLIGHV